MKREARLVLFIQQEYHSRALGKDMPSLANVNKIALQPLPNLPGYHTFSSKSPVNNIGLCMGSALDFALQDSWQDGSSRYSRQAWSPDAMSRMIEQPGSIVQTVVLLRRARACAETTAMGTAINKLCEEDGSGERLGKNSLE